MYLRIKMNLCFLLPNQPRVECLYTAVEEHVSFEHRIVLNVKFILVCKCTHPVFPGEFSFQQFFHLCYQIFITSFPYTRYVAFEEVVIIVCWQCRFRLHIVDQRLQFVGIAILTLLLICILKRTEQVVAFNPLCAVAVAEFRIFDYDGFQFIRCDPFLFAVLKESVDRFL